MNTYKEYFDIDPEYFPAVNSDVIKKEPALWKKFYPHTSFVRLLQNVVNVLNHTTNQNIWVEGAYGTGKSHAVVTLKKLLDASIEDANAYFDSYPSLSADLKKKFLAAKSNSGKIVTVHRYGSSSINSDNDLFLAMQESIEHALKESGISNAGTDALKTSVIKYLSDSENKASFDVYVKGSYSSLFGCDTDTIVSHLREYEGAPLQELMRKIFKVANEKQIKAFTLSGDDMVAWINAVIQENGLGHLIFIWDEFTEYLENNRSRTTGLQQIIEKSQTSDFCFIPVTHNSEALLDEGSRSKILGRFIQPTCKIELPENTAFELIGAALSKNQLLKDEWDDIVDDLQMRTTDARALIKKEAKIDDDKLHGILPMHPYSAYVLKNISSIFNSNQRSMFDFIKNKIEDSDIHAFQWFISNMGPESDNPLLTIDLLWSYFYESDKDALAPNIRLVLDNYSRLQGTLDNDERRILKAVLLLQALSIKTNHSVPMLLPNERNLNIAFEGSDLENNAAARCADKLVRDRILHKKKIARDTEIYAVLTGELDSSAIDAKKKTFREKKTIDLIQNPAFGDAIGLENDVKLRYRLEYATADNFDAVFNKILSKSEGDMCHIYGVVTFSKNPNEASTISSKIKAAFNKNPDCNTIVIDCSRTPLGDDKFEEWVENSAQSAYYLSKDRSQATTYQSYADSILSGWRTQIGKGQMVMCTSKNPLGQSLTNLDSLHEELHDYSLKRYLLGLEHYSGTSNMWVASSLGLGAECGINETTKGLFRSANKNTKLEVALAGAWEVEEYWTKQPSLLISKIKISVDSFISKALQEDGRVSIRSIYELLKKRPTAFLPCNITAFILGFLLKEYRGGKYSWSDNLTRDEMTATKLKEIVEEVVKNDLTPNPRYRDKYIVTMSREEKTFIDATSMAFHLPKSSCSTIEQARDSIRSKMKSLIFPIWTLKWILDTEQLPTDTTVVEKAIDLYCNLANNDNPTVTDSQVAIEIGKLAISEPTLPTSLSILFTQEKCKQGMMAYLATFEQGILVQLAELVDDGGQYINVVRQKFDADASAWVWKKETVDDKIKEAIIEYHVMVASAPYVGKTKKLNETFQHWIEKAKTIRMPFVVVKNEVGSLDEFLSMLLELMQTGRLHSDKLSAFLSAIEKDGSSFIAFCDSQRNLFAKIFAIDLTGLQATDIDVIFSKMQFGSFKLDKVMYTNQLETTINEYKKQLGSQKLRQLWLDKTGTETPRQWSEKYRMPIICMLTEDELKTYIRVFSIINRPTEAKAVEDAISQLQNESFTSRLADAGERDKAFCKAIIGQLNTMLTDIEEVKQFLRDHITASPYEWMNFIQSIQQKLNHLAEKKYNQGGYQKAFSKIDSMDAKAVKSYLKDMIKNNMTVGIEIINS